MSLDKQTGTSSTDNFERADAGVMGLPCSGAGVDGREIGLAAERAPRADGVGPRTLCGVERGGEQAVQRVGREDHIGVDEAEVAERGVGEHRAGGFVARLVHEVTLNHGVGDVVDALCRVVATEVEQALYRLGSYAPVGGHGENAGRYLD